MSLGIARVRLPVKSEYLELPLRPALSLFSHSNIYRATIRNQILPATRRSLLTGE